MVLVRTVLVLVQLAPERRGGRDPRRRCCRCAVRVLSDGEGGRQCPPALAAVRSSRLCLRYALAAASTSTQHSPGVAAPPQGARRPPAPAAACVPRLCVALHPVAVSAAVQRVPSVALPSRGVQRSPAPAVA
jgi:hypothetical protein